MMKNKNTFHIRPIAREEYADAIRLSLQVFTATGQDDFTEEGLEVFKSAIYDEKWVGALTIYGSFEKDSLNGILALKENGKHISLFFVLPEYHKKGIGKALFEYAVNDCPSAEMTVNSSTYAIPFYQSLGFEVTGEKQNYHGLSSTPMKRVDAELLERQKG